MSRAEEIRQRRRTRSGRHRTRRSDRSKKGESMRPIPPVLVRGGSGKKTNKTSNRRPPRRRHDISVSSSTPGTEIRLPSLPRLRIGWRIVSGLISAAMLAVIYFFTTSPEFQVQSVIIQGNKRLSTQEINSVINLVGGSIFEADPILLKQDLHTAFPELYDISVKIGFPAEVLVALRERDPVLAWKQGDQVSWIDSEGVEFPPRGQIGSLIKIESSVPPPAPRTNDLESDDDPSSQISITPEMVTAITTLKSQSPKGMPIVYDPQYGLGWKDPKGWDVYFGLDVFDIQMKLRVYQAIKTELKDQGINPSLISVEHIHAPYYRTEPGL